jgi:SAM-dependent methyltransferase
MEWVAAFYARQHAWIAESGYEDPAMVAERVAALRRLAPPPARVLELGAGDGATAVALARAGYRVVAVELLPEAIAPAREAAPALPPGALEVRVGDMYALAIAGAFDAVAYWDGFGIGSDADQRRLLRRIAGWLSPEGAAVLDVFTPWYWANAAGREDAIGAARRRYGFDPVGCRMLDAWWPDGSPDDAVAQSLRCYGPADLALLLEGTGLRLAAVEPGGCWHAESATWEPRAPLERAMTYTAILRPIGFDS